MISSTKHYFSKKVWLFCLVTLCILVSSSVLAQNTPNDDALQFRRNYAEKPVDRLAPKAGGPTERIEIQSTEDNIDYVIKLYNLKHANAAELIEIISAALEREGGTARAISSAEAGQFFTDEAVKAVSIGQGSRWKYEGKSSFSRSPEFTKGEAISLLVVTMPDWMVPFLDETIAGLDRADYAAADDGTVGIYVRAKYRLPSEIAAAVQATAAGDFTVLYADDARQLLYIEDLPSYLARDLKALETFDTPTLQIETRVRIIEVEENNVKKLGTDWNSIKDSLAGGGIFAHWSNSEGNTVVQPTGINPDTGMPTGFEIIPGIGGGSYDLSLQQLHAIAVLMPGMVADVINFLVYTGNAKVITDTRITQTNGQKATLESVNIVPYVVRGYIGGQQIAGIRQDVPTALDEFGAIKEYKEGVIVEMTPRISEEDTEIQVSALVATMVGRTPNQFVPIVNENSVDTTILLAPGKPAVIAALIREHEVITHKGIWGLEKIPFIGGWLFAKDITSKRRSMVLITIELENAEASESNSVAAEGLTPEEAFPPSGR